MKVKCDWNKRRAEGLTSAIAICRHAPSSNAQFCVKSSNRGKDLNTNSFKLQDLISDTLFFQLAEYTLGNGKDVHGTMVAAETKNAKNKLRKGAYLVFMESIKSLEKEYKKMEQDKKKSE